VVLKTLSIVPAGLTVICMQLILEFGDIFGFGRYLWLTSNIYPDAVIYRVQFEWM